MDPATVRRRMPRRWIPLFALVALSCGGGDGPTPPTDACDFAGAAATLGMGSISIENLFARSVSARSGAWEQSGQAAGFTIIDAYTADASGRPTSELFVFLRARPAVDTVSLVPVTLTQLRTAGFIPPGSIIAFGELYDADAGDYTRWFLGTSGCLAVDQAVANDRIKVRIRAAGTWVNGSGASLGPATLVASVYAPLFSLVTPEDTLRDTMAVTLTGDRAETLRTSTLDAFQVLHADQTRLLIVGSVATDTTREVWLSLPGVPRAGDSIPLASVTVDQALTGRSTQPFAMLRLVVPGTSGGTITEIWPSTSGWVKFDDLIMTGPAALCSAAWGRFAFEAAGTRLESGGGRTSLGTTTASAGSFVTRYTVLPPADTLQDPSRPPATPPRTMLAPTAPNPGDVTPCP